MRIFYWLDLTNTKEGEKGMLDKEISNIFNTITNEWNKDTVQMSIKETLLAKRKGAADGNEYFNLLCENTIYLIESCHAIKRVLATCLKKKTLPQAFSIESALIEEQNKIRKDMGNLLKLLESRFKKDNLWESINSTEIFYSFVKIKYDMELEFLFAFTNPDNKSLMNTFLNYKPIEVLRTMESTSTAYTQLFASSMHYSFKL